MPAARKPRATAQVDAQETPDFFDLDAQTEEEKSEFTQTAPLFKTNGKVYEARTTFTAGEALTYTRTIRERGWDEALAYAMVLAAGEDGWKALVKHPTLSNDQFNEILTQVVSRVNPPVDPKSPKN